MGFELFACYFLQ